MRGTCGGRHNGAQEVRSCWERSFSRRALYRNPPRQSMAGERRLGRSSVEASSSNLARRHPSSGPGANELVAGSTSSRVRGGSELP